MSIYIYIEKEFIIKWLSLEILLSTLKLGGNGSHNKYCISTFLNMVQSGLY